MYSFAGPENTPLCSKIRKQLQNHRTFSACAHVCWRRQWHPTPALLPGKSHGRRSLVGCSPWGRWGSDPTEWLHFHFSLSCIGEGNGNPLQCSCLENPRDRGAWWAAVYGVAQSWTQLKWLSSSSSSSTCVYTHTYTPTLTNKLYSFSFSYTLVNITCSVDHHQLNIQQFYPEHLVLEAEWVLLKVDQEDEDLVNKYIQNSYV